MVEEPRAAPPSEDWPLAGWLARRRTLAGSVAARLLWQPALTSGRAGLAMVHPALRAFVPAIPATPLFEPKAGPLQRRETSWSVVERFWWRRQAPELALLGRRSRWQITPVPVQREQEAAAPATEPAAADLAPEASLGEAVGLELREESPGVASLGHSSELTGAGAPAAGEQPSLPLSQAGPLGAIGRAFTTVMRRLFPTMQHAPVTGSRRPRTLPGTAGDDAQRGLSAVSGTDAVSPAQPVPEAGPAQPPTLGGQGVAGQAPVGAIARQGALAGPALAALPEQGTASPATSAEPLGPAPAPEGEEAPAAPAPAAAFQSSASATGEPVSSVEPPAGAPAVVRRAAPPGYSPPGVQGTIEPAALPAPSLERGEPAPEGGMATLRLRALELWHRVVPRRAGPAGEPAAPAVERAVEPAASLAGKAGENVVEMARHAAETAPQAVEQTLPEPPEVSSGQLPAAPVTAPASGGPATPAAPSPAVARATDLGGAAPAAPGPGLTIAGPAPGGEVDRSAEALASTTSPGPREPWDPQRVSGAPAAPREEPEPAFQPWRPGDPRPAPADLIVPLATVVLQRRGVEASGPVAARPEQAGLSTASTPGRPAAQPLASLGSNAVPPAEAPPSGAISQELPSWAASLSERLRRLQRSAQAEPQPSLQPEDWQGTMPSTGKATVRPAPAGPPQVQRAGNAGAPVPAAQATVAGSGPSGAPQASSGPAVSAPAGLAGGQVSQQPEPPRSAPLQRTLEPVSDAPPGGPEQGPALPSTLSGPGPAGPAPDPVRESTWQRIGLAGAADTRDTGALDAPVELATFPPLVEQLSRRSQAFAARIARRSVELPLANPVAWAEEHAAAAGGLAAEVISHATLPSVAAAALLPGAGETGGAGMASDASSAPLPPEPGGGMSAGAGADAGPRSPYAAYLEAARAAGRLPGAPGSRRSETQPRGHAAGPFRLSDEGSEPAGESGLAWPGARAGIGRAAAHEPFGISGAAMVVQSSAAGAAAGTQEPEPPPEGSAPDQDELTQVLMSLPSAMAAAALAKGVLGPQPEAPSRAGGGVVEPAPLWQPLTRVQAPALVARAPVVPAAGVEETEAQQPLASDWEVSESGSAAPWEASTELEFPRALQRAAEPQPLEAPSAPGLAGEQRPAAPSQAQAVELDRLADEVFELLRWRLAAERERMLR